MGKEKVCSKQLKIDMVYRLINLRLGLVILLHGVPGVRKTSTAECVAAYTRRPLYPITCANIGLDPEEVEEKLTGAIGHFRRAQQWNCVVLLDEADVFLAKREARDNDSKRNALVSVFLRILEYYPGILILTTNRVGAFDEAVVSRIQLFLYYPPLDEEKTMRVWGVHIARVRASGLINIDDEDEDMIMDFAKQEYAEGRRWNGRQIRNFFQTAISLASYDATKRRQRAIEDGRVVENSKPRLTTRTLRIVAETSGKFIDYINATVPDGSHQKQQLDDGNRNDSWEETPKKGLKKR
jgi:SpoVK/Ycf46/Vps4 family AAA+-type ATPase